METATHYDQNDQHGYTMHDVIEPDYVGTVDSITINRIPENIVYIENMPYVLSSYGEPYDDDSRQATLRLWKPF